jgi:hypothetical protein
MYVLMVNDWNVNRYLLTFPDSLSAIFRYKLPSTPHKVST